MVKHKALKKTWIWSEETSAEKIIRILNKGVSKNEVFRKRGMFVMVRDIIFY